MSLASIIALLLLVEQVQEPKFEIEGKVQVRLGAPVEIPVTTDAVSVTWVCFDDKVIFVEPSKLADPRVPIVFILDKGEYRIAAVAAFANGKQRRKDILLVVGDEKQPDKKDPPPPPKPPVVPPPKPVASVKYRIAYIEDSADAANARRDELNEQSVINFLNKYGHEPITLDKNLKDRPPTTIPQDLLKNYIAYIDATKGKKLPWLFIVPIEGGRPVYSGPAKSGKELVELLSK